MNQLHSLLLLAVAMLRERLRPLRTDPERGAGGNTLEILLLAVGGVIVAGIVVAAVYSSINGRTAKLNP